MLCSLYRDFVFKLHVKTVVVCKGRRALSIAFPLFSRISPAKCNKTEQAKKVLRAKGKFAKTANTVKTRV